MNKLTVRQKIAHTASGAAVLRTLVITDAKLTYQPAASRACAGVSATT
jgi:hypothetical protein